MRSLFHIIPNAFDERAIEAIFALAAASPAQDGTVFSTAKEAASIRSSTISWLSDKHLKATLWAHVEAANQAYFNVDVTDQADLQFTSYHASAGGHYDWHHDVHFASQEAVDRKLSLTIQLSDEASYEGGDFEFEEVKTSANLKAKGSLLIFPSYVRHRVRPVTKGTRHSLVAWFMGPRWR